MSVASHLAIALDEYDARIRTFIPDYEEMLHVAATVIGATRPRTMIDLGTGTGALAAAVVLRAPGVRVVGIDQDPGMLALASRRLPPRASLVHDNFLTAPLPPCNAIAASFALHHIASRRAKRNLYVRARKALDPHGVLVTVDCQPSALGRCAAEGRRAWRDHLAVTYGRAKAVALLRAWAEEDFYMSLDVELHLLRSAGFTVDVAWRRGLFAVVVGQT
ncbi:MAG: class I SAM-dependent methyltransferase [Acidobacteria bacterium]|nr:class I SAM-dependent methyltransferase [Acidobacteriota bacterium]